MFSFRSDGTNTEFELCSFACSRSSRSSWSTLSSCLYLSNFSCKNLSSVWLAFKLSVGTGGCSTRRFALGLTTAQVFGSSRAMKRIRNWNTLNVFVDIFNGNRICSVILWTLLLAREAVSLNRLISARWILAEFIITFLVRRAFGGSLMSSYQKLLKNFLWGTYVDFRKLSDEISKSTFCSLTEFWLLNDETSLCNPFKAPNKRYGG